MPVIKINNCDYYYEEHGAGSETILFSHGLLWSGYLFHKQVAFSRGVIVSSPTIIAGKANLPFPKPDTIWTVYTRMSCC